MKKFHFIVVVLYLQTCVFPLLAQTIHPKDSIPVKEYGNVSVYVNTNLLLMDKEGIKVYLVSGKDTLRAEYNNGNFYFNHIPVGIARVYAWTDGFVTDSDTLMVQAGKQIRKNLYLTDRVLQLQAVVVKGHTPAFVYRGDTIRFNPKGVRVLEDDMARHILEQMPGVEISESGVSVMGKMVEKTYVDGKKIFGENPITAIDHVQATDVVNIYAYDEDVHKEQEKKNRKGGRRRVLNIETKSKMINSTDGNLITGVGGNMGKQTTSNHDVRYAAGGCFNFFSEEMLLAVNVMQNNLNRTSNMPMYFLMISRQPFPIYTEASLGDLEFSRRWEKTPGFYKEIKAEYKFTRTASEANRLSEQEYFATDAFQQRSYSNQTHSENRKNSHNAVVGFHMNDEKWGSLAVDYTFQADNSGNDALQRMTNRTDGVLTEGTQRQGDKKTGRRSNGKVAWNFFSGDWRYALTLDYWNRTEDASEHRENDLSGVQEVLLIPSDEMGNKWDINTKIGYSLSQEHSGNIALSYRFLSDNSHIYRMAWNQLTGELDPANTYAYRNHIIEHTPNIALSDLPVGKSKLSMEVGWRHSEVKDRKKETLNEYSKSFDAFVASFSLENKAMNLNYALETRLPDVEQLRSELTNSNPYFLSCGNPHLKEAMMHKIGLSKEFRLDEYGHYLDVRGDWTYVHNLITNRTLYFGEETYLPDYQYTAIANSSLSTFDNLQGAWEGNVSITWEKPFIKQKLQLSVNQAVGYGRTPYYYNNVEDFSRTRKWSGRVTLSINSVPRMRIMTRWNSSYRQTDTKLSGQKNWNWTNGFAADLTYKPFWKYFFANAAYRYQIQTYQGDRPALRQHILNLYVGAKVFKRRGELSLTAYDLFHSSVRQRIQVKDNYINYTDNEDFGRYFTLNFTWTFRKLKSNRADISTGVMW